MRGNIGLPDDAPAGSSRYFLSVSDVRASLRWFRSHPQVADGILVGVLLVCSIAALFAAEAAPGSTERPGDFWGVVLIVGMLAPLTQRHRYPRLALVAVLLATMPYWILDYPDVVGGVGLLVAVYSVASYCDRRPALEMLALVLVVTIPVMLVGVFVEEENLPIAAVVAQVMIFVGAWVLGDSTRNRRLLTEAYRLRAEAAEKAQEEQARRAALDERSRIAREMHDVVAHNMSVMVVQAGGARRMLHQDPAQTEAALEAIEQTGRQALGEMRRLLGVLREDDTTADLSPQPGLAGVEELVSTCNDAGLAVDLAIEGEPRDLPAGIDLSAYRVVQEALTNTLKHAGPALAHVRLDYGETELRIEVVDDGRGAAAARGGPSIGARQGLVGMRERVELYGGRLEAGPRPGGGFGVRATIPYERVPV